MSEVSGHKPQQAGTNSSDREPDLTQQARTLGRDLKNKASELTDTVTRTAKDQAAELSTAAKDFASDASGKIQTAMNDQKNVGADYMGNIAQAIRRAAGELEGDVPQAAQYVRQAAGQIDNVAKAVREHNMGELFGELQQFARRQPTAFFGGAVVLGFAAIRFFKSSAGGSSDGNSGQRNAQNERSAAQSPQAASSISASEGGEANAPRSR